jgi:limonene-1,2-epoxide hydrolase
MKGGQPTQDLDQTGIEADLLLRLPQGGGHRVRVLRIDATTRKGDLTAVAVMGVFGAADEKQMPG